MSRVFNRKLFGVLNAFALVLVASTANSACLWIYHQPDEPKAADRFKMVK